MKSCFVNYQSASFRHSSKAQERLILKISFLKMTMLIKQITSDELLKWRKVFFIRGGYEPAHIASTQFTLTLPSTLLRMLLVFRTGSL